MSPGVVGEDKAYWIVHPTPGYVVKFKEALLAGEKIKCFINVCHCSELPQPAEDLDDEELLARVDDDDFTFKVPLSIGEIDFALDKKDTNSVKIDVVVNSVFYGKRLADRKAEFYRHFVLMVICEAVNDKHKLILDPNASIRLRNRKVFGEIEPMRIAKRPREGEIIKEVESADAPTTSAQVKPADYAKLSGYDTPSNVTLRWLKGETLEIKLQLEERFENAEQLRLRLKSDQLQLLVKKSHSLFDFCFPVLIDASTARSKFDVETQTMTIIARTFLP